MSTHQMSTHEFLKFIKVGSQVLFLGIGYTRLKNQRSVTLFENSPAETRSFRHADANIITQKF